LFAKNIVSLVSLDLTLKQFRPIYCAKVVIEIDDVNDNAPHFRDQYMSMSIRESTSVGSSFALSLAGDLDSPTYAVRTYELITNTPNFGLNVTERKDGSLDARLVIKHMLNRELEDRYQLQV